VIPFKYKSIVVQVHILQIQQHVGKIIEGTLARRAASSSKIITLRGYARLHNLDATQRSFDFHRVGGAKRSTPFRRYMTTSLSCPS
jgi:hypothetical protein